jgi:hypothetical protein
LIGSRLFPHRLTTTTTVQVLDTLVSKATRARMRGAKMHRLAESRALPHPCSGGTSDAPLVTDVLKNPARFSTVWIVAGRLYVLSSALLFGGYQRASLP